MQLILTEKDSFNENLLKPEHLFDKLNALKAEEILPFIKQFCHPDSKLYQEMKEVVCFRKSSPSYFYAFICYAMMTENVLQLDTKELRLAYEFILENHPTSLLLYSLYCMRDIHIQLKDKKNTLGFKNVANFSEPCYVNYSGIDFSKLSTPILKNIDFSIGNCRRIVLAGIYIENLNFSGSNIDNSVFLVLGGQLCIFSNASSIEIQCILPSAFEELHEFYKTLDTLHALLSSSKGIDNIKSAMRKNIIQEIQKIEDDEFQSKIYQLLENHKFTTEHRRIIPWAINGACSIFSKGNVIKTQAEKDLVLLKNSKPKTQEIDAPQTELVNTNSELNGYIQGANMPDNIYNVASILERNDLASFMSTCKFFSKNQTLKRILKEKPMLQLFVGFSFCFYLSTEGKLYSQGNNEYGQLGVKVGCEVPLDLEKNERIKQIALGDKHSLILTTSNKLFFAGFCDDFRDNLRKNSFEIRNDYVLLDGENIEGVVTGAYSTYIFTSKNRILRCGRDYTLELKLQEDEKIKQMVVDANGRIYVITTKGKFLEIFKKKVSECSFLKEGEKVVLLQGRPDSNNMILILTSFNRLMIVRNGKSFECTYPILEEGECIQEISIGVNETIMITNMGRLFWGVNDGLQGKNRNFEDIKIMGLLKGEYVHHAESSYNSMYLVTTIGRVLYCGSKFSNKDKTATFEEYLAGEGDLSFQHEKMLFSVLDSPEILMQTPQAGMALWSGYDE